MPQVLNLYCPDCRGDRTHGFTVHDQADGRLVRARYCSACERITPFAPDETPGTCCRKCGDIRIPVYRIWHRAPGITVRVRRCRWCRNQMQLSERFESTAIPVAVPPMPITLATFDLSELADRVQAAKSKREKRSVADLLRELALQAGLKVL